MGGWLDGVSADQWSVVGGSVLERLMGRGEICYCVSGILGCTIGQMGRNSGVEYWMIGDNGCVRLVCICILCSLMDCESSLASVPVCVVRDA